MKKLLIISFLFLSFIGIAKADVGVSGYFRKNGTYVAPHRRSNPDGILYNNYSYPNR